MSQMPNIVIKCEVKRKDGDEDQLTDLDGAEVDNLEILGNLKIKNNS